MMDAKDYRDLMDILGRAISAHIEQQTNLPVKFKSTGPSLIVFDDIDNDPIPGKTRAANLADLPVSPRDKFKERIKGQNVEQMLVEAMEAYNRYGASAACQALKITGNKTGLPDGRLLIVEYLLRCSLSNQEQAVSEIKEKYQLQSRDATIKRLQRAAGDERITLRLPDTWPRT